LVPHIVKRIGRCPQADIHFDNKQLSWKHAELTATDRGLRIEDLGQNGTAVEQGGQRLDLEKNLPTQLALECIVLMPARLCPGRKSEVMKIEICIPTATVPTEPPPPTQPEMADVLRTITSELVSLRTACVGNHTDLYKQIQSNTENLATQQTETVERINCTIIVVQP
jgi:hypothetical protein